MDEDARRHALFPELSLFESSVRDDPSVFGVLYTGSLGRGDFDRCSDLDVEVWVSDETPLGREGLRQCLHRFGEIHFLQAHDEHSAVGFVGPEWRRVDLSLMRRAALAPMPSIADARVLKDTDGVLERLVAAFPEEVVAGTWEQASEAFQTAVDSQIYLALHNARGAVWSAMGEITHRAGELYTFLARLRGRNSYGYRYVELLLSPDEQALLAETLVTAPRQDEVRRAARALWHWTRYVWAEAERVLGASLGIELDESGLLAAVDRIYDRSD